ncbi:MAG TPA: ABC transporter ATP-binding protein [Candidatus Saccharimonadia bacterium]|nr:ABC transporter ATP-binding protein [Candidatus Saccharimonadia bacterium]
MSSILEVQGLTKSYGKGANAFTALHDVSIAVEKGESLAILGKSGSGKSTLMHLMALLDKPTAGTVSIDGQDASKIAARKLNALRNKTFGFVFQQFFLNANANVLENTILPLKIAGVRSRKRKQLGLEALRQVELDDKARNKAKDLSGGQKQRAVIARALINQPQIIFADEPTGNLDSTTGRKIEDLLFSLNKQHGITLILVTHDEDLAARCDRQIHIKDGLVVGAKEKELVRL